MNLNLNVINIQILGNIKMGNTIDCICSRNVIKGISDSTPSTNEQIIPLEITAGRLGSKEISFQFTYENTKTYLIESKKLIQFINTKSLFKLITSNSDIENNVYFNTLVSANFIGLKQYMLIIMLKKNRQEDLFSFKVDQVTSFAQEDKIKSNLLIKIGIFLKKNYFLVGIVSFDCLAYNYRNYLLIFNKKKIESNLEYSIIVLDTDKINEKEIKVLLMNNNDKIVKSVLREDEDEPHRRRYYFVFETITNQKKQYDYYVMTMNKQDNTNDIFIEEMTTTLNGVQSYYKLSAIISEKNQSFLIFYGEDTKNSSMTSNLFGEFCSSMKMY